MENDLKKKRKSTVARKYDRVVRNWKTVPLCELVDACKYIYGAKYLLVQRREVIDEAKSKGICRGDMVDQMIAKTDIKSWAFKSLTIEM